MFIVSSVLKMNTILFLHILFIKNTSLNIAQLIYKYVNINFDYNICIIAGRKINLQRL